MTTDKQAVDVLSAQGKTTSQEDVPPQTIIPTTLSYRYNVDLTTSTLIIPTAITGGAEGIIPPCEAPCGKFNEVLNFGKAPTIIPSSDPLLDAVVEAEQRRQTVQAEAMVNLAVGVVAAKMSTHGFKFTRDANGKPDKFRIAVSPQELLDFQRLYTVTQEIQPDGGFIIAIAPKEV